MIAHIPNPVGRWRLCAVEHRVVNVDVIPEMEAGDCLALPVAVPV